MAARISVGAFPNSVAQAAGAVWVAVMTVHPRHQGEVVRVDPKTNRVVARIEMPSFPESLVGAEGSVWAAGFERRIGNVLYRIDPATNRIVARIREASGYLAAGAGSVWALGEPPWTRSIVRIDPSTERIVARIDVQNPITDLVFGNGRLWVLVNHPSGGHNNGHVVEIDPRTNGVVARIPVQDGSPKIGAGGGAVWVQGWSRIVRLDARTGRRSTIPLAGNFRPFAYGLGGVWFLGDSPNRRGSSICRLNVATLEEDSCVDPGPSGDLEGSYPVFVLDRGARTIWVSNYRHTITRIDLR